MSIQLLDAALTNAFQASAPFLIEADRGALDITLVVTVAATVEWYLEYTDTNPNAAATVWYRELAESVAASGVVTMPIAVRQIVANGGGNLGIATHNVAATVEKRRVFARVQMRASVGTVTRARVIVEKALPVNSP